MTPTRRVTHALEACPDCGTGLAGGWVQRRREVIDIPVAPVEVTEHVYLARRRPVCQARRTPKAELDETVMGKRRLGVNSDEPDSGPQGGRAAAPGDHPMVSGNGLRVGAKPGRHRRGSKERWPKEATR